MKLFEKASCDRTYNEQALWWNPVGVHEYISEVSHCHGEYGNQTEFALTVSVGCRFFANSAQYADAKKNAEEIISREFFGEVLKWVSYARRAVFEHNAEAALHALGELEKEIVG